MAKVRDWSLAKSLFEVARVFFRLFFCVLGATWFVTRYPAALAVFSLGFIGGICVLAWWGFLWYVSTTSAASPTASPTAPPTTASPTTAPPTTAPPTTASPTTFDCKPQKEEENKALGLCLKCGSTVFQDQTHRVEKNGTLRHFVCPDEVFFARKNPEALGRCPRCNNDVFQHGAHHQGSQVCIVVVIF